MWKWMETPWHLQIICYNFAYFLQGLLFGSLGPCLVVDIPMVSNFDFISFVPLFSTDAFGSCFISMFHELILIWCCSYRLHGMICVMSLGFTIFFFVLPFLFQYGPLIICFAFFFKGICTSLLNITIHRCCALIAAEKQISIEYLVRMLNANFGIGTIMGGLAVYGIKSLTHEITWVFWIYGLLFNAVTALAIATDPPFSNCFDKNGKFQGFFHSPSSTLDHGTNRSHGNFGRGNESIALLGNNLEEEVLGKIPMLPSILIGGIFPKIPTNVGALQLNPNYYNALSNVIVLLGTIQAMFFGGIQIGLCALLSAYMQSQEENLSFIGWTKSSPSSTAQNASIHHFASFSTILGLTCFWFSMLVGFYSFQKCRQIYFSCCSTSNFLIWIQLIGCLISSITLFHWVNKWHLLGLYAFGFCFSSIFIQTMDLIQQYIEEPIAQRMSSLIIFGIGCGEIFLPLLMCFISGNSTGTMINNVFISILCWVSIAMCLVMGGLQYCFYYKQMEN